MLTSNHTGADTATLADTHRYQTFAGAPAVRSAGTDADTDTSDWDYRHGNFATELASGNASSGHAVATGSHSQRLESTMVCFSCDKAGHRVSRCHEFNETFPYMLPGWSAEKVGANYMMKLSGSVMNFNPRTPVVVYISPLPGLRCVHSRWIPMTAGVAVRNLFLFPCHSGLLSGRSTRQSDWQPVEAVSAYAVLVEETPETGGWSCVSRSCRC